MIYLGYGFFVENVDFVVVCECVWVVFLGLLVCVIEVMGDKIVVKNVVVVFDVLVVFGVVCVGLMDDVLVIVVVEVGYLVLIKLLVGGGGKGMWLV